MASSLHLNNPDAVTGRCRCTPKTAWKDALLCPGTPRSERQKDNHFRCEHCRGPAGRIYVLHPLDTWYCSKCAGIKSPLPVITKEQHRALTKGARQ